MTKEETAMFEVIRWKLINAYPASLRAASHLLKKAMRSAYCQGIDDIVNAIKAEGYDIVKCDEPQPPEAA